MFMLDTDKLTRLPYAGLNTDRGHERKRLWPLLSETERHALINNAECTVRLTAAQ